MIKQTSDVIVVRKEGKKVTCGRCGYTWIYFGVNKYVCTCSRHH